MSKKNKSEAVNVAEMFRGMNINEIVKFTGSKVREMFQPEILSLNCRHAEKYSVERLKTLAVSLHESGGNVQPIDICYITELNSIGITDGNRRLAAVIVPEAGEYHFSENKVKQIVSVLNWNVSFRYIGEFSKLEFDILNGLHDTAERLDKAEKFYQVLRLREQALGESAIMRKLGFSKGVVQSAIKALNLAQVASNLAESDKETVKQSIISDYATGALTVADVNAASKILNDEKLSEAERDAKAVEYYNGVKNAVEKVKPFTWAEIDKDIVPSVSAKYQKFIKVLMREEPFDAKDFQD